MGLYRVPSFGFNGGELVLYNMANIRVGSYRKNYEKKVAERFSFQKIRSTRLQSALISFVQFNFLEPDGPTWPCP